MKFTASRHSSTKIWQERKPRESSAATDAAGTAAPEAPAAPTDVSFEK